MSLTPADTVNPAAGRAARPHAVWLSSTPGGVALVAVVAALLCVLGYWTYGAVEDSLREMRAATLAAELDAEVRAARRVDRGQLLAELTAVTIGERGELFAVDRSGVMVSESRLAPAMLGRELRADGERTRLAQGIIASSAAAEREGRRGALLEPYVNHRGETVIGAWRWLADAQVGIAAEMPAEQAYAPLRYLRIAFGVVFGALVAAVAAALYSSLSILRLRGELGGGRKAGAYRLERIVGSGGMANVYLARHDMLKRPCAVKVLKPATATEGVIARFEREVQLGSLLNHPNVVEIYDYGRTTDGLFYYAMEYVDGETLAALVAREGALPVLRALPILRQVCAGLAEAHAEGLVHRDVKPENIMLTRRGAGDEIVKILDFGLVKNVGAEVSKDLTRGLRILGTPLYMAPERLKNPGDVDARADIYSLGAVAFFLLAGRRMFESEDDLTLSSKILNEVPPRVSQVAAQPVPVELDLLVQSCLEKRREDRPQRMADLIVALDAIAAELTAPAR